VIASRLHWRLLVGTILVLIAAAWIAPRFVRPPDIQENRVLAPAPQWPKRLQDVAAFRRAADAYVADHFPARPHLIGALNRLRMLAGVSGSERVIVGRDGWLFYDDLSHLGAARGDPPMLGPEVRPWLMTLAGRTEMLKARGVSYLVVAAPVKETVYPQFGPPWYRGPSPGRPAIVLPSLAREAAIGDVLYLHPALAEATRRGWTTYSRDDTHWNAYGAYAGYAALMNRLHAMGLAEGPRPFSDLRVEPSPVYGPRDLALMLGVASYVPLDFPLLRDPQSKRTAVAYLTPKQDWTSSEVIDTGEVGKPTLLMTRDSFSSEIEPLLYHHFSRLILAHNQEGFWRQDLIDRFKPNIVILEVIEPGLRVGMDRGPPASADAVMRIDRALARATPLPRLDPPDRGTAAAVAAAKFTLNCNVEGADLKPLGGGQAVLDISGWLFEPTTQEAGPVGLVALKGPGGVFTAGLRFDRPRPDVAAALKTPDAARSGYGGAFATPALPTGTYAVSIYRPVRGGWIACAGKQALAAP
jgi:hypothetical protein